MYPKCSHKLLIVFLMNLCVRLVAQNDMATWYFGNYAGLNFMTSPPTIVLNSAMNASSSGVAGASIADASGNLLFYTDGQTVWNSANAVMANGTGLINSSSAAAYQVPLIVKQPGNSNIYFIITYSNMPVSSTALCYSTVDMSLAAGLGSVTAQNVVFATGIYRSAMAATRHCNGRDAWLITQLQVGFGNCLFHSFAVTSSGINLSPVVSTALSALNALYSEMVVSPDGKKIGMQDNSQPAIADFDNNTGIVSNHFILAGPNYLSCYGLAFSPDATKLYTYNQIYLLQWNVCAGSNSAVYASRDSLFLNTNIRDLKLAINGKIYLITNNATQLAVINAPNQPIPLINYVAGAQSIAPNSGSYLPKHENGFKHAPPQTPQFTYTVSNSFGCQTASFTAMPVVQNYTTIGCTVVGYSLTSLAWNFGDPNSGAANTSTLVNSGHFFSALGTYTVQLILYYSCNGANDTLSQVVQVNQPCLSVTSGGILCSSLGTATVSSLIGTGPFSYSWIPSGQTSSIATGLSPGTYTVLVHDITNNTYTATTTFTTSVPLTATLSASSSVSCYGAANGTANIITASGSGNAHYLWSNGLSTFTISSPSSLTAGSWTIIVTDALTGCVADSVFLITQPPPLNIGVSPGTSSICSGSSLALIGSSSGATGIIYQWQPVAGLLSGNTITVTASPSVTTIYTLTASLNSCSEIASCTVYVVPPPNLNVSLSSATACAEALNGSANTITLTAGGASTYTISTPNDIYNSNPNGPVTNLNTLPPHIPGMSTATVYGSNGVCTVSATAIFSILPNPTVSIGSPTPVICAGQSFTYTSAGANSYIWSSGTPGQTVITTGNIAVFNSTTSAVFSVYGGSLGCNSTIQSTTITVNPLPLVNISPNPVTTCIGRPVLLNVLGTGAQYNWNPSLWLSAASSATVYANPPAQQNYTVVASLNSCTNAAIVTVSLLPLPSPIITAATQSVCANSDIELHGSGGVNYFWKGPVSEMQGQDVILKAFSANYSGIYTLTVRDQNSCEASVTQSITVRTLPDGYFDPTGMQGCAPLYADMVFQQVQGSAPLTSLNWQVNNNRFTGTSFSYPFTAAGNYVISGDLTDIYHCANTVTAMVSVYPKPHADFSFIPEHPVEDFEEVHFSNQTLGASSFGWEFINEHNKSTSKDPVFLFHDAGIYPVALVVQNQWSCKDTIVKAVTVVPDFAVYVPNAFTPNDDGKNESFKPVMRNVQRSTFYVFDRWGEKLFETSDPADGWDGSYKGSPCQQGEYAWKLIIVSQGNNIDSKQQSELTGRVLLYK